MMTQKLSLITTTTNLSQRKCINQILPQSTQVFLFFCQTSRKRTSPIELTERTLQDSSYCGPRNLQDISLHPIHPCLMMNASARLATIDIALPSTHQSCTSQTPTLPHCLFGCHTPRLPPTTMHLPSNRLPVHSRATLPAKQ